MTKARSGRPKNVAALGNAGLSFFRMIAEHGSDVASVHARDGRFVFVAPNVERLFGWRSNDLIGDSLVDLCHRDEQMGLRLALQVEGDSTEKVAYRIRCANGELRWAETIVQAGPSPEIVVCMTRDVTEHKENARLLEKTLLAMIDRAPDAVLLVQSGRVRHANPVALERLGVPVNRIEDQPMTSLLHHEDAAREIGALARIEESNALYPLHEVRIIDADRNIVQCEAYAMGVPHAGRNAAFYVFRPRSQVDTERLVADRLRSMGTIAAGLTNELAPPFADLMRALDVLEQDLDAPAEVRRDALERARDAANRAAATVQSVKPFARAEEEFHGVIDARDAAKAALSIASGHLSKTTSLRADLGAEPALVLADPARLAQALLSLLNSALTSASEVEHGAIELRIDRDGERIRIEVHDNGSGISRSGQSKGVDPFFTTKPSGAASVLGLSVAQVIFRALAGKLELESTAGGGTTFRVLLPVASAEHSLAPKAESTPPQSSAAS